MRLFNNNTERDEEIPNELAGNLILSGSHSPYEDDEISMINREGDLEIIKGKNLGKALDNGWRIPDDATDKLNKESTSFVEKDGEAIAAAALRGVTAGISDQALVMAFDVDPEYLRKLKEYNPYLSMAGEAGGILGSLLIPVGGVVGAVAKVAGKTAPAGLVKGLNVAQEFLPSKLFNRANLAVENVVGKAMTKMTGVTPASGMLAKGLVTYLPKGAGSAVEGALYGAGQLISENALGDAELNGENLFAYSSEGAKWGGLLGVAIPGMFDGLVKAATSVPDLIGKTARTFGRYAGIDDNKVDDFLKRPFSIPKDSRGNVLNKEEFSAKLVETAENFKKRVEDRTFEVNEAESALLQYEDFFKSNSEEAKRNLEEAKDLLKLRIKERKELIKNSPIDESLVDSIKDTFVSLEKYRNQLSKESFDILDRTPNVVSEVDELGNKTERPTTISTKNVVNFIKRTLGNIDETTGGIPLAKGEAQQRYFDLVDKKINLFNTYGKEISPMIIPSKAKEFIQSIDDDIKSIGGWWNESPEINFLKKLRSYIDERIKDVIPEYQAKMIEVAEITELLGAIRKRFGKSVKQLASESERIYFDDDAIKSRLIRIAKKEKSASGLINIINDAIGYLPDNQKPNFDFIGKLKDFIRDYRINYSTGYEREKLLEDLVSTDPELRGISAMAGRLEESFNVFDEAKKYLKRTPNEIFEKEIINSLPSLKRVVEQRGKYQDLLASLKKAQDDYNVWKDVSTPEDALNKLSQWESVGKKERLEHLLNQKQRSLKEFYGKLSNLKDEDFVDIVNTFRIEAAFDKTANRGSRNVNLGALIVGAATGGMISPSTGLGMAIGGVLGVIMDAYSPRVAKSVLRTLAKTRTRLTQTSVYKAISEHIPRNEDAVNKASVGMLKKVEEANEELINRVRFSVSDYFKKTISGTRVLGIKISLDQYEKERDNFQKIEDTQGIVNNQYHGMNEIAYMIAPGTTESYFLTYNRAVNFMKEKFPEMENDNISNFKPSDTEKLKFIRYMKYVNDPYIVFDRMKNGVIESDGLEVLRSVYPSIYKTLEGEIAREVTRINPKEIPVLKKSELTREFGYKFTYTNSPMIFNILQKPSIKKEEATKQTANINLKSKAGGRSETVMNRIENRV